MKKIKTRTKVIGAILLAFVLLHTTPGLSLGTHLFLTGHFKTALTSSIVENKARADDNTKYFSFDPMPVDWQSGNPLVVYKTTQYLFIYVTSFYGAP